jgi:vesicle coat complex subunit
VLDVLLVNQTTETLQNLTVEFATLGDLKVVERPPTQNVGPHDFINLQSTIKGKRCPRYSRKTFFGPIANYHSVLDRYWCDLR